MKPFIYTSGYCVHTDEVWQDGVGFKLKEQGGAHAMFAARVPFIPSFLSDDFTRMVASEMGRIRLIVGRQIRFINDLASAKENAATFDLRFISTPRPNQPNSQIDIVFIGKAFHENRRQADQLAHELWAKFYGHFPLEDPFNYPLLPVQDEQGFMQCLEPLPLGSIQASSLAEVRKYEDRDPLVSQDSILGYFPHPFSPMLDFSAMGRFLETLAKQQDQRCVVGISLQPTSLYQGELMQLNQMLSQYWKLYKEGSEGWLEPYRKERFEDLRRTYDPLINQRKHLFSIKIQVLAEREVPVDLVDALGSEFMNNSTPEPRLWSRVQPANDEDLQIARDNFVLLEHKKWGASMTDPRIRRLPFLVTAYEAAGAFRLPIPPESGYMPGIIVRDEPFVLPSEVVPPDTGEPDLAIGDLDPRVVSLGGIYHRGTPSGVEYNIPLRDLKRHALVAGATGSGKTNTCLLILSQLWSQYQIPFLVIYPIDKPDYRLLMAERTVRDQLLIFTLGDETTSPFRFNPFYIPKGVLLKTHLSRLMRSFMAAFAMWDPLPAVYRDALRNVYRNRGWDLTTGKGGDPGTTYPTLAEFYDAIVDSAERLTAGYGSEAKGNVRQGSEIRIRDLAQNTSMIINVDGATPLTDMLARPTVMELGRVGSSEDIALVMGFLLTALTEELESAQKDVPQSQRTRLHATLIEEAHRLMSRGQYGSEFLADPRAKGAEDFANILAEVRGFGEMVLLAEQIPTNLVLGAVANTHVKIMHWLEDEASFDLFEDILSLNELQREYTRTLDVGQAIVRGKSGRPVHVQVMNYLDKLQHADDTPVVDDSDGAVRAFMTDRVELPLALPWAPRDVVIRRWGERACGFCRVPCSFGEIIGRARIDAERYRDVGAAAKKENWPQVRQLCLDAVRQAGLEPSGDTAYCYLARMAGSRSSDGRSNLEVYPYVHMALRTFHILDEREGSSQEP